MLSSKIAHLMELFAQEIAGSLRMGHGRRLRIKRRNDNHPYRSQLPRGSDNLVHRITALLADCRIGGKNKSVEAGTYRTHLNGTTTQSIFDLFYTSFQSASSRLEAHDAMLLHKIEFLLQAIAGGNSFLKRYIQLSFRCFSA